MTIPPAVKTALASLIAEAFAAHNTAMLGKTNLVLQASDYQEDKNINTVGDAIYPNTAFKQVKLSVVNGPSVSWRSRPT